MFIAILSVIYVGYLFVQARERKRMKRYYGYSTSRRSQQSLRKAA